MRTIRMDRQTHVETIPEKLVGVLVTIVPHRLVVFSRQSLCLSTSSL